MTLTKHFTPQDWDRIKKDWTAWWHHDIERPMVNFSNLEFETSRKCYMLGFDGWDLEKGIFPIDEILDFHTENLRNDRFYGDSWPRFWPNFGPGIVSGYLGARVGTDGRTTWFEPPNDAGIADIHPKFDPDNFFWRWGKALTQAAVNRWKEQVTVSFIDLGGNMDVLASLRGSQNLIFDLYDAPQELDRLVGQVTQHWLRYYDELYEIIKTSGNGTSAWTPMWCPGSYYMLQSDFAYMISPEMFERFIMPDLEACCSHLEYGFYHLDGKGQIPHLDMLLSIENLRGVQWIPGDGAPPPEQWLPVLSQIRSAGKLCQVFVSPEGALTIARELGGKGFTFVVDYSLPEVELDGFVKTLTAL